MFQLIEKFFNRNNHQDKNKIRKNFDHYFFSLPEHAWILEKEVRVHFEKLISHLPSGVLDAMMKKYPITFITEKAWKEKQAQGEMRGSSIVVFPVFQKLLQSKKREAVAYLAHELAFVLYELEGKHEDPLMAEVAADKFVCDIGFSIELEEHLLHLDETIERRLRLTYLTINHFTSNDQ